MLLLKNEYFTQFATILQ